MNTWLVSEGVLLLVLAIALWRRKQMAGYFQIVSMTVCALLIAVNLSQSVIDGPSASTLGLGALALTFFGVEIVRQMRSAPNRDG